MVEEACVLFMFFPFVFSYISLEFSAPFTGLPRSVLGPPLTAGYGFPAHP